MDMKRNQLGFAIVGAFAILIVVVSLLSLTTKPVSNITAITQTTTTTVPPTIFKTSLSVPAVDAQGNGVATKLVVEAKQGTGRVLVDVNQLLFWIDTQFSIQTAKKVAQQVTGLDLSETDLTYSIETNATLIEGPSAGAALAIATIAAAQGKHLTSDVMITGTINPDGTVGSVGGIVAKAKAAKDIGATLFLVPSGQGSQTNYVPEQSCTQTGAFTVCSITYKPSTTNVMQVSGVNVIEVTTVQDALKYFGL